METVRVATFNLENLGPPRTPGPGEDVSDSVVERWRRDHDRHIDATRSVLARLRADVVALQEVLDYDTLRATLNGTRYESFETSPMDPSPTIERHQVILSRYPIKQFQLHRQQSRMLWVDRPDGQPDQVEWNRPIVDVNIDLPGIGPTRILSVHLKSKRPSDVPGVERNPYGGWPSLGAHAEGMVLSSLKRVGQALEVRRLVDELHEQHHDARVIVLGDFNDTVDSVPVSIVRGSYIEAHNPMLWDQELYPVELSLPREKQYTLIHNGSPQMIDHVFISRSLLAQFHSATILNETVLDHWTAYPPQTFFPDSDHAAVVMDLISEPAQDNAR